MAYLLSQVGKGRIVIERPRRQRQLAQVVDVIDGSKLDVARHQGRVQIPSRYFTGAVERDIKLKPIPNSVSRCRDGVANSQIQGIPMILYKLNAGDVILDPQSIGVKKMEHSRAAVVIGNLQFS